MDKNKKQKNTIISKVADNLLFFSINKNNGICAIDVDSVREVSKLKKMIPASLAAENIIGLVNLRGEVIPILDLQCKMTGVKSKIIDDLQVIIVQSKDEHIGLLVNNIIRMSEVNQKNFSPALPNLDDINADLINQVYHYEEKVVPVLNLENILDISQKA